MSKTDDGTTGNTLAIPEGGNLVRDAGDLHSIAEIKRALLDPDARERLTQVVDDPDSLSREIVAQLLGAESMDELFTMGKATGWRELEGVPMEIHNFRWRPSTYEEGSAIFLVIQATRLDTGASMVLTTGSLNVVAQLVKLAELGKLQGAKVKLVRAPKPTKSGFYPLWLAQLGGEEAALAESMADPSNPLDED